MRQPCSTVLVRNHSRKLRKLDIPVIHTLIFQNLLKGSAFPVDGDGEAFGSRPKETLVETYRH